MSARSHPHRLPVAVVTGSVLVLGSIVGQSGSARAAGAAFSPSACVTTPSAVVPDVLIADPTCQFDQRVLYRAVQPDRQRQRPAVPGLDRHRRQRGSPTG